MTRFEFEITDPYCYGEHLFRYHYFYQVYNFDKAIVFNHRNNMVTNWNLEIP